MLVALRGVVSAVGWGNCCPGLCLGGEEGGIGVIIGQLHESLRRLCHVPPGSPTTQVSPHSPYSLISIKRWPTSLVGGERLVVLVLVFAETKDVAESKESWRRDQG
jgi:hypothetical protein